MEKSNTGFSAEMSKNKNCNIQIEKELKWKLMPGTKERDRLEESERRNERKGIRNMWWLHGYHREENAKTHDNGTEMMNGVEVAAVNMLKKRTKKKINK